MKRQAEKEGSLTSTARAGPDKGPRSSVASGQNHTTLAHRKSPKLAIVCERDENPSVSAAEGAKGRRTGRARTASWFPPVWNFPNRENELPKLGKNGGRAESERGLVSDSKAGGEAAAHHHKTIMSHICRANGASGGRSVSRRRVDSGLKHLLGRESRRPVIRCHVKYSTLRAHSSDWTAPSRPGSPPPFFNVCHFFFFFLFSFFFLHGGGDSAGRGSPRAVSHRRLTASPGRLCLLRLTPESDGGVWRDGARPIAAVRAVQVWDAPNPGNHFRCKEPES